MTKTAVGTKVQEAIQHSHGCQSHQDNHPCGNVVTLRVDPMGTLPFVKKYHDAVVKYEAENNKAKKSTQSMSNESFSFTRNVYFLP